MQRIYTARPQHLLIIKINWLSYCFSYHSIWIDRMVRKSFLLAIIKQSKWTVTQSPRSRAETRVRETEREHVRGQKADIKLLSCCVFLTVLRSSYLIQNYCCFIIVAVPFHSDSQYDLFIRVSRANEGLISDVVTKIVNVYNNLISSCLIVAEWNWSEYSLHFARI